MKAVLSTRDILVSVGFHGVAVVLALAPLSMTTRKPFLGEVIRVNIVAGPEVSIAEPPPSEPIAIPRAIEPEPEDIPISSPETTKPVPIEEEKPKPTPEPQKPPPENKIKPAVTGETKQSGGEDGEIDVEATGGGSPFAGATVDNATYDYPWWFNVAFRDLAQNFNNPVNTDARLVCKVYFQVIRSGRVAKVEVIESSGIPAFDNACVAAVQRAAPFPPLDREFAEEVIGITVPFTNR